MQEMRTIEIDFDVHRAIETERKSFHESENTALRRLLKLPEVPQATGGANGLDKPSGNGAWIGKGVQLESGTQLRMHYRGKEYRGVIKDSRWEVEGQHFKSPSGAASGVAETKNGAPAALDGWTYWQVRRPGDTRWVTLKTLRILRRRALRKPDQASVS